jgi:hypothetical protein
MVFLQRGEDTMKLREREEAAQLAAGRYLC